MNGNKVHAINKFFIFLADDVRGSLHWLRHNYNFPEIEQHWLKTAKVRHDLLKKGTESVSDYLKQYPALGDPNHGHSLVDIDFKTLFENRADDFYHKWEPMAKLIQKTIKKKKKLSDDETELMNIIDDDETNQRESNNKIYSLITVYICNTNFELIETFYNIDVKEFAQILLLAFAIPPRAGVSMRDKKYWKPSTKESQKGFAVHVKVGLGHHTFVYEILYY